VPFFPRRAVVEIFNAEVAEPLPGETAVGENAQLDATGSPDEQVRETVAPRFPPRAMTVAV
jgi:hypothetical protein